jgi:hypothetical protein
MGNRSDRRGKNLAKTQACHTVERLIVGARTKLTIVREFS